MLLRGLLLLLPALTAAQSSTVYTTPTTTSTSLLVIQTVPYTGQSLLVGTCALPVYTILQFPDGTLLEVPLIGCSDDRPDCCPSLNTTDATVAATSTSRPSSGDNDAISSETGSTSTSGSSSGDGDATSSGTGTISTRLPTGVVSMLSNAPLTVCPSDMVDIDPVCCPRGFTTYGQRIVGNLPCVSNQTTSIAIPSGVESSLTSSLAQAYISSSSGPVVTVIYQQVFALGLPCADADEEHDHEASGLSTGAKAGIGAGIGVLGLVIILGLWLCLAVRHRRRLKMKEEQQQQQAAAAAAATLGSVSYQADPKHASMSKTSFPGSPMQPMGYTHPQPPPIHLPYGGGVQGYGSTPQGYGPAFGYVPVQHHQQPPQDHMYGTATQGFGADHISQSGSPSSPPFYGFSNYQDDAAARQQHTAGLVEADASSSGRPLGVQTPGSSDAGGGRGSYGAGEGPRYGDTLSNTSTTGRSNPAAAAELG